MFTAVQKYIYFLDFVCVWMSSKSKPWWLKYGCYTENVLLSSQWIERRNGMATNGGIPCIAYTFRGMCEHSMFIIFVILHVHFYVFYMCWIVFAFAFDVVHWALTYSCCLHMTLHSTKHMECIRMEFAQPYSGTYVRFKFKYYFLSAICVQFRQKLYLPFNFTISTLPANERYREMRNNFSTQKFSLHMKRDALICTNNFCGGAKFMVHEVWGGIFGNIQWFSITMTQFRQ